jgi:hypothetical protein
MPVLTLTSFREIALWSLLVSSYTVLSLPWKQKQLDLRQLNPDFSTRNSKDARNSSVRSLHSQNFLHLHMSCKHLLERKSGGLEMLHLEIHLRAQSHQELSLVLIRIDRNFLPQVQ